MHENVPAVVTVTFSGAILTMGTNCRPWLLLLLPLEARRTEEKAGTVAVDASKTVRKRRIDFFVDFIFVQKTRSSDIYRLKIARFFRPNNMKS